MDLTFAWSASLIALQAVAAGTPPQPPTASPIESVVALRAHFQNIHMPAVSAYATASLAARVCPHDKAAGERLYIEAIRELNNLPESAFTEASDLLPITSFAALYRFIAVGTNRCEPKLTSELTVDSIRARIERARQNAAANLTAARGLADTNPDRAAQLAAAALGASRPEDFDVKGFVTLLCRLRERAPDLADDLFEQALTFEAEATVPNPGVFDELARYVFIAQKLRENPDKEGQVRTYEVSGASFTDLTETRHSSNPESVLAFLTTVINLLKDTQAASRSPVAAYALAYQLLPKTRELAPDLTGKYEDVLAAVGAIAANYTGQIMAALATGGGQGSVDAEVDPDRKRDRFVAKVLYKWKARQYTAAKEAVHPIDDLNICSQLYSLIDFGLATAAAERKEVGEALSFTSGLPRGVKRTILYTSIAAAEKSRDAGLDVIKLALREAEVLPAEFRASALLAITKILLPMDREWGYGSFSRAVVAFNAASLKPRQTVFDPRKARKLYFTLDIDTSTDAPFTLHTRNGFYEVVDSERSRRNFPLKAPAVDSFDLQSILGSLDSADAERLVSIALGIRNDTKRVSALLGIADMMIRKLQPAAVTIGPEESGSRARRGPSS